MLKLILPLCLASSFAFADTAKEDVNNTKRSAKKSVHKVEEKVCAEGDVKCAGKKAKHRTEEGKDYVKDKVNENK